MVEAVQKNHKKTNPSSVHVFLYVGSESPCGFDIFPTYRQWWETIQRNLRKKVVKLLPHLLVPKTYLETYQLYWNPSDFPDDPNLNRHAKKQNTLLHSIIFSLVLGILKNGMIQPTQLWSTSYNINHQPMCLLFFISQLPIATRHFEASIAQHIWWSQKNLGIFFGWKQRQV